MTRHPENLLLWLHRTDDVLHVIDRCSRQLKTAITRASLWAWSAINSHPTAPRKSTTFKH